MLKTISSQNKAQNAKEGRAINNDSPFSYMWYQTFYFIMCSLNQLVI